MFLFTQTHAKQNCKPHHINKGIYLEHEIYVLMIKGRHPRQGSDISSAVTLFPGRRNKSRQPRSSHGNHPVKSVIALTTLDWYLTLRLNRKNHEVLLTIKSAEHR